MTGIWQEKDILITVKTYPEYSRTYTETVCTCGILSESKELIRIYPIKYRYLEGDSKFSKYQWIRADIRKAQRDNRLESYNIRNESIVIGKRIPTNKNGWLEREQWLLTEKNVYGSLEALSRAREEFKVSLGVVKPKEVIGLKIIEKSQTEKDEALAKKESIMRQLDMLQEKKDLDLMPVRFILTFLCDDPQCRKHKLSILDWEISELYRKLKHNDDWRGRVEDKVMKEICGNDRETFLILGNMALHQHIFCILGFFWPPKRRQRRLF